MCDGALTLAAKHWRNWLAKTFVASFETGLAGGPLIGFDQCHAWRILMAGIRFMAQRLASLFPFQFLVCGGRVALVELIEKKPLATLTFSEVMDGAAHRLARRKG